MPSLAVVARRRTVSTAESADSAVVTAFASNDSKVRAGPTGWLTHPTSNADDERGDEGTTRASRLYGPRTG